MGASVGTLPILNWLLVGYGVPAVAFWAAARQLPSPHPDVAPAHRRRRRCAARGPAAYFQIRQLSWRRRPRLDHRATSKSGLMALVSLGLAYALMRLDLGRAKLVFRFASIAFGVVSGLLIVFGSGFAENPLFKSPIGQGSGRLQLAGAGLCCCRDRRWRPSPRAQPAAPVRNGMSTGLAALAALLFFAYVTLEMRHAFQGEFIASTALHQLDGDLGYSAAWLAARHRLPRLRHLPPELRRASGLGSTRVALGRQSVPVRSRRVVGNLARALSFIVLGLVLIGIGLAYQKLLFGRPAQGAIPQLPPS